MHLEAPARLPQRVADVLSDAALALAPRVALGSDQGFELVVRELEYARESAVAYLGHHLLAHLALDVVAAAGAGAP